ncbi:hypothetical protein [Methylophilus aquaticus]|uniref:Uncharacterized protein n=1 Tax=Methylophilus aquaticus TaxID=1971610 RepID=A0ABT9JQI9_9PROT|nr:hypothetical protein [Methylophilus aquaticus]MDP8566813.1 hypothetical protein [Methylophilus aquaticus]
MMWLHLDLPGIHFARISLHNTPLQASHLETWIDHNPVLLRLLEVWQSLGHHGEWQQDAFMLCVCLAMCVMLFLAGTVFALFVQSLWGIFTTVTQQSESEQK